MACLRLVQVWATRPAQTCRFSAFCCKAKSSTNLRHVFLQRVPNQKAAPTSATFSSSVRLPLLTDRAMLSTRRGSEVMADSI